MSNKINEIKTIDYTYNGKSLTFIKPLIMAIVNITPDSFYDGNKYDNANDVLRDVEEKIKQGADIIDIGAASSRPNAKEISETEEWQRLENVIREVRKNFPDTFRLHRYLSKQYCQKKCLCRSRHRKRYSWGEF